MRRKEIDQEALNRAVKDFADEMEERYEFYSSGEYKKAKHPKYSGSSHVLMGKTNIALLAGRWCGLYEKSVHPYDDHFKRIFMRDVRNDLADPDSPFMTKIWNSEALKDNEDVKRILKTEAKFVLYNLPEPNTLRYGLTRAFGEIAGAFGYKEMRDQTRNIVQIRAAAEAKVAELSL